MSEPVLSLQNIIKSFGGENAVDGVSLDIRQGEFLTLLGPSGCGKSTTLNMVAGFLTPDSGNILLAGKLINDLPPFARNTGMVFQNYALFPHMSVANNVAFGLKMRKVPREDIAVRVERALALVRLTGLGERMPLQLSGGQQQRVALARALVIEPEVLLLDEPLSNLDMKLREEMRIEITTIQKEVGITTLFVTHDQGEALVMSDRVAVMNKGQIVQVGPPADIYERPESKFVAGFIGMTNAFYGHIGDIAADGTAQFSTERGLKIPALAPAGSHAGQAMNFSLRPERCTLAAKPKDKPHAISLAAQVEQVVYLGSKTAYILRLDQGESAMVEVQNLGRAKGYVAGDKLYLIADQRDCLILPA